MNNKEDYDYWREYEHLTGLYKDYLGIMVNLGVFSFAVIGGISSYVLNHAASGIIHYALYFPLIFSIGLTILYGLSVKPAIELNRALKILGSEKLNVLLPPHSYLLIIGVVLLGLLYLIIDLGLVIILCKLI